ncbi:hypothetical protein [Streptomyces sp. NBC_01497]|uniref:hypothetical protein n=1 Tax=Streptomyces sp. NBC_01497 TaxID=2903885 RepID=UPI002E303033|nr:hypothetical protein [Streptomyces sp. NBC_01497]
MTLPRGQHPPAATDRLGVRNAFDQAVDAVCVGRRAPRTEIELYAAIRRDFWLIRMSRTELTCKYDLPDQVIDEVLDVPRYSAARGPWEMERALPDMPGADRAARPSAADSLLTLFGAGLGVAGVRAYVELRKDAAETERERLRQRAETTREHIRQAAGTERERIRQSGPQASAGPTGPTGPAGPA